MGAMRWGTGETRPPTVSESGDIICHVPHIFFLGFVICWFHTNLSSPHFTTKLRPYLLCMSIKRTWTWN